MIDIGIKCYLNRILPDYPFEVKINVVTFKKRIIEGGVLINSITLQSK